MKKLKTLSLLVISLLLLGNGCAANVPQTYSANVPTPPARVQEAQPQDAPPPVAVFSTALSLGSSGTVVANLQQFLADEGLYSGRDTGIFDRATADAVIGFQRQEGIAPSSGVFGSAEQARANAIMAVHPDWLTTLSNNKAYSNVNGSQVHSPSYSTNGIPAGATAVCGDGTYSFSMHRSGTCSHHGGVSEWLN